MKRIPLGPACLDLCDGDAVRGFIADRIVRRVPGQAVTFNALMFHHALRHPRFAETVRNAALVIPDSAGIVWAARLLAGVSVERRSGIDLADELCRMAADNGWRIFFLGAAPDLARQAADRLAARYPGLTIAGAMHGYFSAAEEPAILEAVRDSRPDIVLVALSVPRQDQWIADNLSSFGAPLVMGVGGSFDVIAGRLKRAPRWMQKAGLEWLYRTLRQPWRLRRIKDLPVFVIDVLKLKFRS